MASHSSLDPDAVPVRLDRTGESGLNTTTLGPSDSSNTGADSAASGVTSQLDMPDVDDAVLMDLDSGDPSDRERTGERLTVELEPDVRIGVDISFDRIIRAEEAGLGGGLDQAEEAQLGITDEELADRLVDEE